MAGQLLSCPACGHDQLISDGDAAIAVPLEDDHGHEAPDELAGNEKATSKKWSFDKDTSTLAEHQFKRPLIKDGDRASRVRTFHCRLSEGAISYMEEQINTWLDGNPEIEIKFANSTVGVVESKTHDPHLIVTAWY